MQSRYDISTRWALPAILVAAALLRLVFSVSISGNDDLSVAACALTLLDDGFAVPTGHYCARFGLILPMAAIFGVAGTGAAQISILPAIASMGGIVLAGWFGTRLFGRLAGLAAATALALFPMDIAHAGLAFPDATQGTLLAAALACLLHAGDRDRVGWAALAGALWAWAYYVKLDAFFLGAVIVLAWGLGYVRFRHMVIAGLVALALVGIELAAYGMATGDPLWRMKLERIAANEILAEGRDYRDWFTYPKAMFVIPYETGVFFYAWVAAIGAAIWTRSRPALLLAGWSLVWMAWLALGSDPASGFRLKPQLSRYLLSFVVPVAVLAGWVWMLVWRRTRAAGVAAAATAVGCAAMFTPINQLSFEAVQATRIAVREADRNGWFPLCPDVQSRSIVNFLLWRDPRVAEPCTVQLHDFLKGETVFTPPATTPSYLLVNEGFARRLEDRNLVRPLRPDRFALRESLLLEVRNPMPAVSYGALHLLSAGAALGPAALRDRIHATRDNVLSQPDARIWRLDAP